MRTLGDIKFCNPNTKEHRDAKALIEFVFEYGGNTGEVTIPNEEIVRKLNWMVRHGSGRYSIDGSRYRRARAHAMERIDQNAHPCCGYRLNYRASGQSSVLSLLDPHGRVGHLAAAALASTMGWLARQKQHHTENVRILEQIQALRDWTFGAGDKYGFEILTKAITEVDTTHTITERTVGELHVWAESLAAA